MSRREPIVRRARPRDADAISDVYLDSARHHTALDPDYYREPAREDVLRRYQLELSRSVEASALLVAVVDGFVVGVVEVEERQPAGAASMVRPRKAVDAGAAVLEEYRGAGIGRRLMEAAEAWGRERGAEVMLLDVSAANTGALRFYERLGYTVSGLFLAKPLTQEDS